VGRLRRLWAHFGVVLFNIVGTRIPSHHIRLGLLRLWGAEIGRDCSILMGSTVLGIDTLRIGEATSIGFRCVLDARGGLTIGSNVVIASDTQFIGAYHDVNSPNFQAIVEPIVVEDYVWIASRATVLCGVTIGRGAVVGACALVNEDIAPMSMVAGVPAKPVGTRTSSLEYRPVFRPPFF
jgi:acetyltransferase-like isoleucine patch superfamily enzyme